MQNPEYSDLYKFIVSIGLILITLSLIIPWIILKEPIGTLLDNKDVADLSIELQNLVTYREKIIVFIISNIEKITIFFLLLGSLLLIYGFKKWNKQQIKEDYKKSLEIKNLEKSLTLDEKVMKISEKAFDSNFNKDISKSESRRNLKRINDYMNIENMVFNKLSDCFSQGRIKKNIKVGDKFVDAIIRLRNNERLLLQLNYYNSISSSFENTNFHEKMLFDVIKEYKTISGIKVFGISLLLYNNSLHNENYGVEIIERLGSIKIIKISIDEFVKISSEDLIKMFSFKN